MSQRVIIEISRDWEGNIVKDPRAFGEAVLRALRNSREGDELQLATGFGAKIVARRHHSEDVEAKIGTRTVKWG